MDSATRRPLIVPWSRRPRSHRLLVLALAGLVALTGAGWLYLTPATSGTPRPVSACPTKPAAANTGALTAGVVRHLREITGPRSTLQNAVVPGALAISADGATLRHVKVAGVVTVTADDVVLENVTAEGIVISGAEGVSVRSSNISGSDVGIRVGSADGPAGRSTDAVADVVLAGNYVHDTGSSQSPSFTGTHVAGADGVSISCSTYALAGDGQSAVHLDGANGGVSDVLVENNWFDGGAYALVTAATGLTLRGNVFGDGSRLGMCRTLSTSAILQVANRRSDGRAVNPCPTPATPTTSPSPTATPSSSPSPSKTPTPTTSTSSSPEPEASVTSSSTPTSAASPTRTTSATVTRPPSTSSPSPAAGCAMKPSASNTGASGTRKNSSVTVLKSGQTLSDVNVSELEIQGDNVTVRNVKSAGYILVLGKNVVLSRVTTEGVGISSGSNVVVEYANIGNTEGDGIHITSDRGSMVRNVTLRYNYVHSPNVPATAHYDGTQVRGVDGLTIRCSVYDPGPYRSNYNAAVYLEWANGGDYNVLVESNWLYGFGFSVMVDAKSTTIRNNRIGGDLRWGPCYLGKNSGAGGFTSYGNVWDASGARVDLCGQG